MEERLQKIIAAAGIASRRKAEGLITEGRVAVNGTVVRELGAKADAARDHIRVDGKLLHGPEEKTYLMLNKPKGYVTTVSDPEGRQTVMDLVKARGSKGRSERLYPVGRLDYGSEGLLLMTNDGDLANRLTKASAHVPKTYEVKVSGRVPAEAVAKLRAGVFLPPEPGKAAKGVKTGPCEIRLLREAENPWYEITLVEGRNRQIRRMFEQVGHHVEKIKRVRFGPLVLNLEPGEYRELSRKEIGMLKSPQVAQLSPRRKPERPKHFSVKRAERQHAAWQKNKSINHGGHGGTQSALVGNANADPLSQSPQRPSLGMTSGKREFRGSETRHAASLREGASDQRPFSRGKRNGLDRVAPSVSPGGQSRPGKNAKFSRSKQRTGETPVPTQSKAARKEFGRKPEKKFAWSKFGSRNRGGKR